MHDPGEHSSPVRLPFGSFPVINILLSHTDYLLQTNRAACTLFRLLSCVACKLCKPGKYQTMIVNRITSRNADHVYTVFFQRTFFLSGYFRERKEKRIFVLRQTEESFIFLFPAGIPVIPAFYTWKERFPGFGKPRRLLVIFVFDYTTKVHNILYCAIDVHIFLYYFNRYLIFGPK